MPAIIFTDINNVLCLGDPYGRADAVAALEGRHPKDQQVFEALFSRSAVSVLTRVHARLGGDVRYVVSSTWRKTLARGQLQQVFARSGLPSIADNLHEGDAWCTPLLDAQAERLHEIDAWLLRHHVAQDPVVVLDDVYSGSSFLEERSTVLAGLEQRAILCHRGIGLLEEHEDAIVGIVNRQLRDPR